MDGKKATRRNWANGDNKDIVLYFDCVAYMYMYFPDWSKTILSTVASAYAFMHMHGSYTQDQKR